MVYTSRTNHDTSAILRFLQRRFTTISTLEDGGYVVQWQAK